MLHSRWGLQANLANCRQSSAFGSSRMFASRRRPTFTPRPPSKQHSVRAILLTPERTSSSTTQQGSPQPGQPGYSIKDLLVPTHFSWGGGGEVVEIWGSWNGWEKAVKMHRAGTGQPHRAIISLPVGTIEYKYKVDGQWKVSVKEETMSSSQGVLNNFRIVNPTLNFSISAPEAQRAWVVGDWDDWLYSLPLTKDPATGNWTGCTNLQRGQYCYQYILDQRVAHNTEEEAGVYPGRGIVNMDWAVEHPPFKLFYCSGWDEVTLHYRRVSPSGHRDTHEFTAERMFHASSRGSSLGQWYTSVVVPLQQGEQLEFYLSNGKTGSDIKEDKPNGSKSGNNTHSSGYYTMLSAGAYKLSWGVIKPFPRGSEPRFMLVSDIDGTMIGDHSDPAQYDSSKRFRDYWESGPALAGSILIYNTGRSMGQVKEMLKTVSQVARPDAMIVAVGTKVFINTDELGRAHTSGLNWVEDMEWSRQLDEGWNLSVVRKHGRRLMDQYGSSGQLGVLDDGSEHQHRFSLSADVSIAEQVSRSLMESCKRDGLEVRLIISGNGSHRYLDCVPMAAGKEKALQFLRAKYDIPEHYCVAAGDSGNDVLMLEGDHPSIVVGNAQAELLNWLMKQPQNGKVVLSDAPLADGIIEGLARHGLF